MDVEGTTCDATVAFIKSNKEKGFRGNNLWILILLRLSGLSRLTQVGIGDEKADGFDRRGCQLRLGWCSQ